MITKRILKWKKKERKEHEGERQIKEEWLLKCKKRKNKNKKEMR